MILYYGTKAPPPNAFWIPDSGLLAEKGIRPIAPKVHIFKGLPAFFFVNSQESDLPFDLLALIFFLVSRYEEYLPAIRDQHHRFPARESLAFRHQFLELPLVNLWIRRFAILLKEQYPAFVIPQPVFRFRPTYDVDFPWAFRNRSLFRHAGAIFSSLKNGRLSDISNRLKVLSGKRKDPFDTFGFLNHLHQQHQLTALYFILVGQPARPYDRNIKPTHPAMRRLIESLESS